MTLTSERRRAIVNREIELEIIPKQLIDYVEGDLDEQSVETLVKSRRQSSNDGCEDTTKAAAIATNGIEKQPLEASDAEFKTRMSLAIQRSEWVTRVLVDTPRRPLMQRSLGGSSTSLHSYSNNTSPCTSPHPSSSPTSTLDTPDPMPMTPTSAILDDVHWRDVAYNIMTFKLGVHPSDPKASVGKNVDDTYQILQDDAERCFTQIVTEARAWAERALSVRKQKRISLSAIVPMNNSESEPPIHELKLSPKMFLHADDDDTELRAFVGTSASGVPLMRLVLLRCKENSMRTSSVCIAGLIIVDIDFAEIIDFVGDPYIRWIIKGLVKNLIPQYDFVRLSSKFSEQHRDIVETLIIDGVFGEYSGRVVCYSRRRFSELPRENSLPIINTAAILL
jgi:hypothetical protein